MPSATTAAVSASIADGQAAIEAEWLCALDALDVMLIYFLVGAALVVLIVRVSAGLLRQRSSDTGRGRSRTNEDSTGGAYVGPVGTTVSGAWKSRLVTPAKASRSGESCDWTNACLSWLYLHQDRSPRLVHAWIQGLNDYARFNPVRSTDVLVCFAIYQSNNYN